MSDHILKVYEHYHGASQQFDYFVTGLIGAMCAYTIQHLQPQRLSDFPYTLQTIALFTLLGSLIIALKNLEAKIELLKTNAIRLEQGDSLKGLTLALTNRGPDPIMLTYASEIHIADQAFVSKTIPVVQKAIKELKEKEEELATESLKTYRWRNRLLILGFILLTVSKIIEPYFIKPQ